VIGENPLQSRSKPAKECRKMSQSAEPMELFARSRVNLCGAKKAANADESDRSAVLSD
jgi:hypothetical protein